MLWCTRFAEVVTEADHSATQKWSKLKRDSADARYLAALRVNHLYQLCRKWAKVRELNAKQLPYMIGCIIDTHLHLVTHPQKLEPYVVYHLKLEPEAVPLGSIVHDSQTVSNEFLENIWQDLHDSAVEGSLKTLWKLLSKGLPRPSSIRYIMNSLRGIFSAPPIDPYVLTLVRRFFLGAYQHVTVIAPPGVRLKLYQPEELLGEYCISRLESMSSKGRYIMLAEALIGFSYHHPSLFSLLEARDVWTEYYDQAIGVANNDLRQLWYESERGASKPRSPKINIAPAPTKCSSIKVFQAIQRCLNSSRFKLPTKLVLEANKVIPLEKFYTLCRRMPCNDRLYPAMLRRLGMTAKGIKILTAESQKIRNGRIQKQVNRIIGMLSTQDKAILTLCLHWKNMRNSLCVRRLEGTAKRTPTKTDGCVLVCYGCFTIRSQSKGFARRKTKECALLDLTDDGRAVCSECGSLDVRRVDVANHVVRGNSVNQPGQLHSITMCTRCELPTRIAGTIGEYPFCSTCLKSAQDGLRAKVCLCGTALPKTGNHGVVLDSQHGCAMYGLCSKHRAAFLSHFRPTRIPHVDVVVKVLGIDPQRINLNV